MEFTEFKEQKQKHFENNMSGSTHLFKVHFEKDEIWELYLNSFPEGTNPIYRERREYDDSACRHFIRSFGGVVAIKDNKMISLWDFDTNDDKFQVVIEALRKFVHSKMVEDVYVTKVSKIGTDYNHENDNGNVTRWDHLYIELPKKFVSTSSLSEASIAGSFRDTKNVFKRSLDELTQESVKTVLELIGSNSLYKGEEWKNVLESFLEYKTKYDKLKTKKEKDLFAWEKSILAGSVVGRIRNHSMGTLLIDISEGIDLEVAVKKYERIVAPSNYKRPKPIYSKKMLEDAKNKIEDLGYMNSLQRRHAVIDDITVNNVIFSNRDSAKAMSNDPFEEMSNSIPINPKKFSKVEEIGIEDFIKNVIPHANEIEVMLDNKHTSNMVSLIAPVNKEAPSMFKWDNAFSWAYSGNITDSQLKENVKMAGGKVDGVLRFSIQWNDEEYDSNDLDAHAIEPSGYEIYFGNRDKISPSGGKLDVDIVRPNHGQVAVENIVWSSKEKLKEGTYKMIVDNYNHRGGRNGFRAEIEYDGQIFSFNYDQNVKEDEKILVAEVHYSTQNGFSIVEKLPSSVSSKETWGVKSNQFVPVSIMMFSPNYWDEQTGIGNKHYFFMLKNCVNPEKPNGFYNEFLKNELAEHRKVFEALGGKMAVEAVDNQLSGVGFSSTQRNTVTVKVKGQTERVLKVTI